MNGHPVDFVFLFLDVVRYSRIKDPLQHDIAQRFTSAVEGELPLLRTGAGFVLPTGDGLVIALRTDRGVAEAAPHAMLDVAERFQARLRPYDLRIGLHAGRGREYTDFNGKHFYRSQQPAEGPPHSRANNVSGTGINTAQRVMSLADPGDILATEDFVKFFGEERGKAEADQRFDDLGSVKVKHGTELKIYRYRKSLRAPTTRRLPRRVDDYRTAQSAIFSLLRRIHNSIDQCGRAAGGPLHPRISLLLYDELTDEEDKILKVLKVSEYRYWVDIGRNVPHSDAMFSLDEGPGRAFKQKRVHYIELPSHEESASSYETEFHQKSGIPITMIRTFTRKSRSYLYYPAFYGVTDDPSTLREDQFYGVLSIDTSFPLVNEAKIRDQLFRERKPVRMQSQQSAQRLHDAVNKRVDDIGKLLLPSVRQLGYAWTVINHY